METIKGKEEELKIMKAKELGKLHEDSSDLGFVDEQVESPTTKGKSLKNKRISKVKCKIKKSKEPSPLVHSHLNSIISICISVCYFWNVIVHTKSICHEYIRQCKLGNKMHVSEMRKSSMNVSCMITLWILCMLMIIM